LSIASFVQYLQLEKKYSSHSVTAYQRDLTSFLTFCVQNFGRTDIENLDYSFIRYWIVSLVDNKLSNRSVNRKMSALKSYYNFLLKSKQIDSHPMATHKSLKTSKRVNVPFNMDEMKEVMELLASGDDLISLRNRLIVEMLYTTGMRRAELIGLNDSDIDLSAGVYKVTGKRNKQRYIPILNSVVPTINRYRELKGQTPGTEEAFFNTETGKRLYPTLVYRIVNDYFSKVSSKVKKSPHIIRHSFATHLLNEGADLNSVKELLGHSSLASTQVYTHNSLNELKKMYNQAHPRSVKNQEL
jgi:integrase/recombinase XerC